jgi:GDSL-like Lipase/Acylhydrolase
MVKHSPLLLGLLLWLPGLASANTDDTAVPPFLLSQPTINGKLPADIAAKLSAKPNKPPHPMKLANILYLGDSYLDDGNYEALTGLPPQYFSNEPPWGTDVNVTLGLTAVGRWTAAGSPPNPLGNNYAVAGASIVTGLTPVDTSFRAQVNLLLSDYPNGLPANSLVVVAIGTNDVFAAMNAGGIWSINPRGWRLNHSGFTVPAVGSTVTVRVTDTFGLVAGLYNRVIFPDTPGLTILDVTGVNAETSTVTLSNVTGTPGTLVSPSAKFEMAARDILDSESAIFTQEINALLADGASVVLTLPWRTDILPLYNQGTDQGLAYTTWLYLYTKMAEVIFKESPQVLYFDLSDFFDMVYFNYANYGFLYNYPGWDLNPDVGPNEYVFWDVVHPSGLMHQLIAGDFIQFLQQWGLEASSKTDGPNERHLSGVGLSK